MIYRNQQGRGPACTDTAHLLGLVVARLGALVDLVLLESLPMLSTNTD
jgi:hypothetical protein